MCSVKISAGGISVQSIHQPFYACIQCICIHASMYLLGITILYYNVKHTHFHSLFQRKIRDSCIYNSYLTKLYMLLDFDKVK